ncbi:hypothetical protein MKX01_004048 [Papaver californicum]|nr:hypothetical protein MKX01_004048 [Papaver californicum]
MEIASERDDFSCSGPLHLTTVDWGNINHRRSIAACLVQGVYVLEHDRQLNRQAFAPPWWEFFGFQLLCTLVDDVDSSIFGAVYEFKPEANYSAEIPRCVIAFRGTMAERDSVSQDLKLDLNLVQNGLHQTSRFQNAMQTVRNMVSVSGASNVWLTGHSMGSSIAMLAGKNMAKTGNFLESFLFNPPFGAGGIERLATQNSLTGLLMNAMGWEYQEELQLIPSAHLTINRSPSPTFKRAHGIHQWFRGDLSLQSKVYQYKL